MRLLLLTLPCTLAVVEFELPVVDLASADAAARLDLAARSHGFATVTRHGAEAEAAAALAALGRWFRARAGAPDPAATKKRPAMP